MTDPTPPTLGSFVRMLRQSRGLKLREVSERCSIPMGALGNQESSVYPVMGRKRMIALADGLGIDESTRARLLELHALAPLSAFQTSQRARWDAEKARKKDMGDRNRLDKQCRALELELGEVRLLLAAEVDRTRLLRERIVELEAKIAADPRLDPASAHYDPAAEFAEMARRGTPLCPRCNLFAPPAHGCEGTTSPDDGYQTEADDFGGGA